ncbi:lactococcin 972 family bacteriocin [Rathayibacter sp. Leaf248]|uniref:lactococcin 972 family bacteriocin n=1 Tax=Rathayibacter sp. Leaf248 TaxID=2876555 RepID=UPI001E3C8910|nr:lactococcin 972 family bacteriocin [Rathayibacter sp. Leaf248]
MITRRSRRGSRRSLITTLALAGTLIAAPAAAAAYTTSYPEGGTWVHGVSNGDVLSSYNHPSRKHRASIDNGWLQSTGCKNPKVNAGIFGKARMWQTDYAYYAFC